MLHHKLYDSKLFWSLREKKRIFLLNFNIVKFRLTEKYIVEKEKISLSKLYFLEILKNILRSIFFILFLYAIEYYTQKEYNNNLGNLSTSIKSYLDIIPKPTYPESKDAVIQFISLLASVSGVLLALFYPILATIASTGYAKVNSSIRNLLFIEPVTQNYLRKLAFLTSYAVFTLLLITVGYNPGNLILFILVYLGLTSLFSLLKLGAGVYNLFEPETLSKIVNKEISSDIKSVTIESIYWNNTNFQDYFRKKTERNLEKIRLINEMGFDGVDLNKQSFLNTISQTFGLLGLYLINKNKIPINSKWFKNKQLHKSFFETSSTDRELSLNTKSYVRAEFKANNLWFEEEIFQIYNEIGRKLTSIKNQDVKSEYLEKCLKSLEYFGVTFEYELAEKLLSDNLLIAIDSIDYKSNQTYQETKSNLLIAEAFIYSIRSFQHSFFNSVESLRVDTFNNEMNKINWSDKRSLYRLNLPPILYQNIEDYFRYIEHEISIEGRQITPIWYINQHISAEYLLLIDKVLKKSLEQIENLILPFIKRCENEKNSLLLSFICHLSLELIDKIEFRLPRISKVMEGFNENNKYKGSYIWTSIEEDKVKAKTSELRDYILIIISQNMQEIASTKWNSDYPDIFARSFSIISNELNQCFIDKDLEKFKLVFPPFLKSSLKSFFALHKRYKGKYSNEFELIYQVHLELMQICGISYIYSKLTGILFWEVIKSNFDDINITKQEINLLIGSYTFYKQNKYGTGINYNENFQRNKKLVDFIKNNNIDVLEFKEDIFYRFISSNVSSNKRGYEDIFIEMYLFTYIDAREIALALSKTGRLRDLFNYIVNLTERANGKI